MKPDFSKIAIATAGKTKTTGISPFSELEISKVYPNPDQPRKQFDDIEELAATIKEHGLLQPITVVKKDDRYMIISGERRYKAHLHNEAKTIKAYILDKTDEQIEELALIENIQRNDLTDYETAKGVVKLWESGRYAKKSDLAEKLGKKDSYISKAFSTLKLDTSIIEDIEQNNSDISLSVIDEIARVKDPVVQKEVYEKYNNKEITRDEIKDFKEPKKQKSLKEKIEEFETPVACNYVEEENSPRGNAEEKQKFVCYGFGTKNEFGAFVTPVDHDIKTPFDYQFGGINGVLKFNHLQQIIKINHSNNINYKITIEEISDMEYAYIDKMRKNFNDALKKTKEYQPINYKHRDVLELFDDYTTLKVKYEELEKEIEELKKSSNESQTQEPIKDDEPITIKSLKDEKEIALLELLKEAVVIHYTNYDIDMGIDYKEAKKVIDKSKQDSIPFNVGKGTDERAYRLINTDIRTIKDDCIVFIDKEIK